MAEFLFHPFLYARITLRFRKSLIKLFRSQMRVVNQKSPEAIGFDP